MRTRSLRNLSLNKLRSELIQNKKSKEREVLAIIKGVKEIKQKVDNYTKREYELYLEAKERYEPTLKRESTKWFFVNKKLIHDLQSKIEEHAPPNFFKLTGPLSYYLTAPLP